MEAARETATKLQADGYAGAFPTEVE